MGQWSAQRRNYCQLQQLRFLGCPAQAWSTRVPVMTCISASVRARSPPFVHLYSVEARASLLFSFNSNHPIAILINVLTELEFQRYILAFLSSTEFSQM
jgi:hypothetical protein